MIKINFPGGSKFNRKEKQAIRKLLSGLLTVVGERIRNIRLFGSRARGDFDSCSDIDILLVVDRKDLELRGKVYGVVTDVFLDNLIDISLKIRDQSEYRGSLSGPPNIFLENVKREGFDLWKQKGAA